MKNKTKLAIIPVIFFLLIAPFPTSAQDQFTKLDATGKELPASTETWSMVRDNKTGLIWEAKSTDGSIHDMNNAYSWKKHKKE